MGCALLLVTGCGSPDSAPSAAASSASKPRDASAYLAALERSVHAGLDCSECHAARPGAEGAAAELRCDHCHEAEAKEHVASVHGESIARGKTWAAQCWDCHGSHDVVKVSDRDSPVAKMHLPKTCAKCHQNSQIAKLHGSGPPLTGDDYLESTHGRGLIQDGLVVAPSCVDCHGPAHSLRRATDPLSPISHGNVVATCGRCHQGIEETFGTSIHYELLKQGDPRAPACVDCHTAHRIEKPRDGLFKLEADNRCGKCHAERLARYRETYHGRSAALGQVRVAACFDCHGHHDIHRTSDPRSTLFGEHRLETCRKCHPGAPPNFAGYQAHGDHSDRKAYPILYWTYVFMTTLLLGVFAFFGLHTLLWLVRSVTLYRRNPAAFREAKASMRKEKDGRVYTRFRPVDRFCHFLVIISFLLLTLTGMPLKFYDAAWAQGMFDWMGGPRAAGALHRFGAVLTGIYFTIHIGSVLSSVWRRRREFRGAKGRLSVRRFLAHAFGPDSPMPNWRDVQDFWAHQKWFFGRGPRPQFDRWTYWEKFDYLAVFWGVAIIGLSGLVMWFPEAVTRLFPGWIINVAHLIHSDEALLATGFIFTFHFFNVHFRLEKFPMDPVIFSGRITEEEMLHERRRQYDRLKAAGRLDDELVRDEWSRWRRIFTPIGMLAFTIGVLLVLAIYWVMASRLLHG